MNTLVTSNTVEPPETTEGREYGPEASQDVTQPSGDGSRLRHSRPATPSGNGVSTDESACAIADECTYETDEIEETKETKETEEAQEGKEAKQIGQATDTSHSAEKQEIDKLSPDLLERIDAAISKYRVPSDGNVNRPLFMLAHEQCSIEEDRNVRFSLSVLAEVVRRWRARNHDHLDDDYETVARLLAALADGLNFKQACLAVGIHENTLRLWREKYPELEQRMS